MTKVIDEVTEQAKVALSKAKIQLMLRPDTVFYSTLCFSLVHKFTYDTITADADGKILRFNPKFFMGLTPEQRLFLLLHETMHCAYLHMVRLLGRMHKKFNIACDHVINLQLLARGFKMPPGGYADTKYLGMGAEAVYALLPDDEYKDFEMDLKPCEGDLADLVKGMDEILIRASIQSKLAEDRPGTIPDDIQIYLNKLLDPKLPWHRILQKYLQRFSKCDYSYRRPNKKYFPKHILPSLYSESLINIAIAVDTSGSVTDDEFLVFISEVHGILRMKKPDNLTLIQFDTEIKSTDRIKNVLDLMKVKFTGRGGTQIGPVMEWANKNRPQLLLVFSDGGFHFYDDESRINTVWLIHNNESFTAPYGKVIHYEITK